MSLAGRHIVLGLTGSIAAYKAAALTRLLVSAGAEVRVVMTPLAKQFITPLTMATLSRGPILVDFFDPENGAWNSHVSLGLWADCLLIAPATANTLAKMGTGVADNLLLTTYLSARCPVMVAPAMDLDMFAHPATQQNLETLRQRGVSVVAPGQGELASGLIGKGRMADPEQIVQAVSALLGGGELAGRKFLVTAGPTREALDPVRYLSNYSTGKMGYAIASALVQKGAEVTLVSGPTALPAPAGVCRMNVESAQEMLEACKTAFDQADGAVMCAAVADYAPLESAAQKLKKQDALELKLRKTPDIAATLGARKGNRLLVGFALETENELQNAREKLRRKNLDLLVLNSLNDAGAGFGHDTNRVTMLTADTEEKLPLLSKKETAERIVGQIIALCYAR